MYNKSFISKLFFILLFGILLNKFNQILLYESLVDRDVWQKINEKRRTYREKKPTIIQNNDMKSGKHSNEMSFFHNLNAGLN